MPFTLETQIDIDAPAARVWDVLTDFASYPSWNPFAVKAEGALVNGGPLKVVLRQPGGRPMTIKPRVSRLEPGREFAWKGRLLSGALFEGEHRFEVIALAPGKTRLVQSERFRGVLVPLAKRMLTTKTRAGFEAMNAAVKARAEAT